MNILLHIDIFSGNYNEKNLIDFLGKGVQEGKVIKNVVCTTQSCHTVTHGNVYKYMYVPVYKCLLRY